MIPLLKVFFIMRFRSLLALCGLALSLAACMPAAPQVDASLLNSLVITDVVVEVKNMSDGDSEVQVIRASGRDPLLPESGEWLRSEEGQKQLHQHVSTLIKEQFQAHARHRLKGTTKARLVVNVEYFDIPSAMRRIIIGGVPMGVFTATLIEVPSGRVIATSPKLSNHIENGQGVFGVAFESALKSSSAPSASLLTAGAMASKYFDWLLQAR